MTQAPLSSAGQGNLGQADCSQRGLQPSPCLLCLHGRRLHRILLPAVTRQLMRLPAKQGGSSTAPENTWCQACVSLQHAASPARAPCPCMKHESLGRGISQGGHTDGEMGMAWAAWFGTFFGQEATKAASGCAHFVGQRAVHAVSVANAIVDGHFWYASIQKGKAHRQGQDKLGQGRLLTKRSATLPLSAVSPWMPHAPDSPPCSHHAADAAVCQTRGIQHSTRGYLASGLCRFSCECSLSLHKE